MVAVPRRRVAPRRRRRRRCRNDRFGVHFRLRKVEKNCAAGEMKESTGLSVRRSASRARAPRPREAEYSARLDNIVPGIANSEELF